MIFLASKIGEFSKLISESEMLGGGTYNKLYKCKIRYAEINYVN
jgi:hypothetical protein